MEILWLRQKLESNLLEIGFANNLLFIQSSK